MENIDKKNSAFKTTIGGQALIEGIMMRGPSKISIAVRRPDGEIEVKTEETNSLDKKYKILTLPIIRGAYKLVESMIIGSKALTYSASFYDDTDKKKENFLDKKFKDKAEKIENAFALVVSFVIAILFFTVLPNFLASMFKNYISSTILLNLFEGLIRILIFLIYLSYTKKIADIKRVYMYHGAEHKSIHCYESREDLTVDNVMKFPRMHPRCGTSFIFMVLLISIVVLSFFGWPNPFMRIIIRIIALPLIAGISYEVNRIIGRSDLAIAKTLAYPGILIQKYFTVSEPDREQVEVAIAALKEVLPRDGENDLWT
ncbi:hypothetical protein HMPREF3189_00196 [Clostridiales bacterium KA00134]|nr:hypothetical protein HMPREF3189_00196 [Clostridiales bacterium KA00134]